VIQLDEDVRVLLQRFDAEGADEAEQKSQMICFSLCHCFSYSELQC